MNYKESGQIKALVEKSERILVNCHVSPDPDCVSGALAIFDVLSKMGKDVDVICPNELPEVFCFMKNSDKIKTIEPAEFTFTVYDLFISIDTSSWEMVSGNTDILLPAMPIVVIDHHATNTLFGEINIVDTTKASATEVLYAILQDLGIEVKDELATLLLVGIIGDTGSFQYSNTKPETLLNAAVLMRAGADRDEIAYNLFQQHDMGTMRFIGEFAGNMQFDHESKFVWTAIDNRSYSAIGNPDNTRITDILLKSIKDTELGVRMVEEKPETLKISFRARNGVDVAKLAQELGGGGHKAAAGATVSGLPFSEAVDKVLYTTRKYLKDINI